MSGESRNYPEWLVEAVAQALRDFIGRGHGADAAEDYAEVAVDAIFDARPPCPSCQCGYREESPNTHPHVAGCPASIGHVGARFSGERVILAEPLDGAWYSPAEGIVRRLEKTNALAESFGFPLPSWVPVFREVRPYQEGETR